MIGILKTLIAKYRLYKQKQHYEIGSSHLFDGFRLILYHPIPNKKYLYVGDDTILDCKVIFESNEGTVTIGNRSYIGDSTIICRSEVVFEDNIFVAWGCCFYDHNSHSIDYRERENDITQQLKDFRSGHLFIKNKNWDVVSSKPIRVRSNAWIGMNSIILKGVTIGEGAVVAAGSVVTKDVAPWTIVGGNPAIFIKEVPHKKV
ncbi:acyltransferase [Pedobacter helvus]|uniref:Acyltransferase n=1 Tax=Pedobacter helvus TaxID=2563444 RepID=A0ABW9JEV3_9SPHI|nr:acyltransferase [Pedobacter ureilyticus]